MFKKITMLVAIASVAMCSLLTAQPAIGPGAQLPQDPLVRTGTFENGMTYYIRHNSKQPGLADFYIYHDVGAIQEEDNQNGLAHFLEHMAFNGTENLPDKTLLDYLESIGVKFGYNLNAGTGAELTFYRMSDVPLRREGIVDTALLILHDWSHFIALEDEEIDNERGVIVEELRTRNDAQTRLYEAKFPYIYNGSKYAYRNVIGSEELLRNFSYQEIKDFYHRWYRPDLQAVIIVGDIDVDAVYGKLEAMMADIPAAVDTEPKVPILIPDNEEPIVAVITDPELMYSRAEIMVKREPFPLEMGNMFDVYFINTIVNIIEKATYNRLEDIFKRPNSPFIEAVAYDNELTATSDAFNLFAATREGETARGFEALYTELEKIRRYGFTDSEVQRATEQLASVARTQYENRNDRKNQEYVWNYINHFRKNHPIMSAEDKWAVDSLLYSVIDQMQVNMIAQQLITAENQVVIISSPEKEGVTVPTVEEVMELIDKVRSADIEPYADDVERVPLIDRELTAGTVVDSSVDHFGATVWTLSNGAKIVIKPTDFRADEVQMNINSKGGMSLLTDEEIFTGAALRDIVSMGGIGRFSSIDLSKQLSGKIASVVPTVQEYENGFSGHSSVRDFETLLQLVHLYFTEPRFTEEDFEMTIDRFRTIFVNIGNNPDFVFSRELMDIVYNNVRRSQMSLEKIERIRFDLLEPIYNKFYGNPADFVYTFVGNIDPEEVKPLIEKYIGSLPTVTSNRSSIDDGVRMTSGRVDHAFTTPMQMPKTRVAFIYNGQADFTLANMLNYDYLAQILTMRYTTTIREEKGGTYGVTVVENLKDEPVNYYILQVIFDTDPELAAELMELIPIEIEKIAAEGPTGEDMSKVREYMVKQRQEELRQNRNWINYIDSYYINGIDLTTDYDTVLDSVDAASVQAVASKILEDGNLVLVTMFPERTE